MYPTHWDPEATPNPSQEGNFRGAEECLLPSWEGLGVGRLRECLLSLLRMHWDHEPWKAPASRSHSERFAKSQALGHCAAAFGVRGACSRFRTRFMEREDRLRRGRTLAPLPGGLKAGSVHGKAPFAFAHGQITFRRMRASAARLCSFRIQ